MLRLVVALCITLNMLACSSSGADIQSTEDAGPAVGADATLPKLGSAGRGDGSATDERGGEAGIGGVDGGGTAAEMGSNPFSEHGGAPDASPVGRLCIENGIGYDLGKGYTIGCVQYVCQEDHSIAAFPVPRCDAGSPG